MGREIRKVPFDWAHPKAQEYVPSRDPSEQSRWVETDNYQPLYDEDYASGRKVAASKLAASEGYV